MNDDYSTLDIFTEFQKIPRLSRDCVITEKLDGTNAQISISENGQIRAGSRTRWITPEADNYGFARWIKANETELLKLGPGRHFGEWWGQGIQRNYGLKEKRLSLFAVHQWEENGLPTDLVSLVPILYKGLFSTEAIATIIENLRISGSIAAPGFPKPEGIIIYHTTAKTLFKKTLEGDDSYKGKN